MRWLQFAMAGLVLVFVAIAPAWAVRPDEMLPQPKLEARARALSRQLRCLVCQNEDIDDSDADLAHDLRVVVRQRIVAGDTDKQVLDYIVARYGEFVLLKPRFDLRNAALWATPVVLLLAGGIAIVLGERKRRRMKEVAPLTAEENEQLGRILRQGNP